MKKLAFLLFAALNFISSYTQITFNRNYPGYMAKSILQLADGSYLFTGRKDSMFYLGRMTEKGKILWDKKLAVKNESTGRNIIRTKDKNFIAVGESVSLTESNYYVYKFDSTGTKIFEKQYRLTLDESAKTIIETSTGDFWIIGESGYYAGSSNIAYILKINSDGDSITTKTFSAIGNISFNDIIKTYDNNYMMVGTNSGNVTLLKINEAGDSLWSKQYVDPWTYGKSLVQTPDSGLIICTDGGSVLRVDKTGTQLWNKGGWDWDYPGYDGVSYQKVIKTMDGNYAVTGFDNYDSWGWVFVTLLAKFDINGDTLWTREYLQPALYNEGLGLVQTKDSGYMIAGDVWDTTSSYPLFEYINFLKTDKFGNVIKIDTPSVCLVTLDPVTQKNRIIWERQNTGGIENYAIFRKDGLKWKSLGNKHYDSLSVFIDTGSSPEKYHYQYCIAAINLNGDTSAYSPFVETVLLQSSSATNGTTANLIWNPYLDESGKFTPAYYFIYKSNSKTGIYDMIDSISGDTKSPSYNDNKYDRTATYYQIRFNKEKACSPAIKLLKSEAGPYTQSLSNIVEYKAAKLKETNVLSASVYPNPVINNFTLQFDMENSSDVIIQITDVAGKIVYENIMKNQPAGFNQIVLSKEQCHLSTGTYFIKFTAKDSNSILSIFCAN
jgi:hypothetical protein